VCSVEAMSHCLYLLHKFVILMNYFLLCVVYLRPTALLEYLDLLQGLKPPSPQVATLMIEIQYNSTALLLSYACHIETIAPRAPLIYHLKRRHFVASYVQPIMKQYESVPSLNKRMCLT